MHGRTPAPLGNFDQLPDSAFVRQAVVLGLFSCSKATLWRWVKSSRIPSPVRLGSRLTAWQVGPLRTCLRKIEASACNGLEGGTK
ncbi:MAG: AlpA family phage regulatory protein [Nitrosomonadales bacterium]|nr:AlpA family phage regulatory protein [Nitrosomonadales bacterium]